MQVSVEIPEDIARSLTSGRVLPDRAALEGLAAEGYRSGVLSESQVRRLLNFTSRFEVHQWLQERQIPYQYTETDLAADLATFSDVGFR